MTSDRESQLASTVLMVKPARFYANPMAAVSNNFMQDTDLSKSEEQAIAAKEFDGVVAALSAAGVRVIVVDDTPEPETPDAIFPNNWMTTHANGSVVLYPMQVPNRRPERRSDIIDLLRDEYGYRISNVIDLSGHEAREQYLEGTGSLVLDRINSIAYACLSPRTHLEVLGDFAQRLDYEIVTFDASDREGVAIYHTNVLMNVGEDFAVICLDAIPRKEQRQAVVSSLEATGHEIINLSFEQLLSMAGNMLEIMSESGDRLIAMSEQAKRSLEPAQIESITAHAKIVSAPIDTIEMTAGGSVRCMLAEIHLPVQDAH